MQDSMTFTEIAKQRGLTRLGVYMRFKRNLHRLTEGEDYTREPLHSRTIITPAGYAKLYPRERTTPPGPSSIPRNYLNSNYSVC